MIYTVTFSPSLDYTVKVNNFEKGSLNRTCGERITPGGKGINVSSVLKNLGIPSKALGFVGGFTGDAVIDMLAEKGVETDMIKCRGLSRINVKVKSGEETEINGQGAEITEENLCELIAKLGCLGKEDFLVLAGNVPSSLPSDVYERIMTSVSACGVKTAVDATGKLLLGTLKYRPFLIKPNNLELGELFGVKIESIADTAEYAAKLQRLGARNVIVSLGGEGAYMLTDGGESLYSPAPEGKVKDTVGAGDSLVAGFIAEYSECGDYRRAFLRGIATGSATAFKDGLAGKAESDELFYALMNKNGENK